MKSLSKLFLGICAVGLLTLVSCDKDDDSAPSKPQNAGIFKGNFINPTDGGQSEWVATSTEAKHDTLSGEVRIKAQNAAGDVIRVLLSSNEPGIYSLFQNTSSESTYKTSGSSTTATTRSNDVPTDSGPKESKIQITDNGDEDGILKGTIHSIQWYTVGEEINDDVRIGILNSGTFEIPLAKGANMSGSGQANITALINGTAFTPTMVSGIGFMLTATDMTETIMVQLPNNAALGMHDFTSSSSSYNVTYISGITAFNMTGYINLIDFNSIDGTATGTFEATATPMAGGESVLISDGTFRF